jgi:hypothetical protein
MQGRPAEDPFTVTQIFSVPEKKHKGEVLISVSMNYF